MIFYTLFLLSRSGTSHNFVSANRGAVLNVIITGPSEVTVGVAADFRCSAQCSIPCSYRWLVQGKTVDGPSLAVTPTSGGDSIEIQCTATDPQTSKSSARMKQVKVKNPYEVIPMADEPKENEAFNLTCSGPSELLQVFWYRNNKPVTLDRWMSLSRKNATLSFSKLLESHSGYYLCQASIGTVTIQSTEYLLTFDSIILMIIGPDTVEVGEPAVFKCLVNCSFGCSIFWTYKNGFPSGTYLQRGTTINWTPSIPNITQNFTCVAEKPESRQSASAHKSVRITDRKPTNLPKSGADELISKMPKGVAIAVWLSFILSF
ncbi:uncharacterized protein [Paramormyrops kingsleyae]|uniref:uncharacterized protein n=1 Tax=Paramormyrops kingsleyae TaxID=1676925 RepID=UPI000CD5DF47|nr:uncharacterized protein LOC111841669 [Paramormyrops kingsleyae]XP_023663344.1 uncharacterized protein LOC111841669 [Paramormyrops kingsleyae]